MVCGGFLPIPPILLDSSNENSPQTPCFLEHGSRISPEPLIFISLAEIP